jgi:DNA-binding NarL/FixJ family response regulator
MAEHALRLGFTGWLEMPFSSAMLQSAITAALAGCRVLVQPQDAGADGCFRQAAGSARMTRCFGGLTRRQSEIMDLLATGRTEKEVACQLCLSGRTVNHYVERIYRKYAVRNRAGALHRWFQDRNGFPIP